MTTMIARYISYGMSAVFGVTLAAHYGSEVEA